MLGSAIFHFLSMLFAVVTGYTYTPCDPKCVDEATATQLATMKMRLFRTNLDDYTEVPIDDVLLLFDELTLAKPTVVYVYGWTGELEGSHNQRSADAVIGAYIERDCCNVLQLNWAAISLTEYTFAANSVEGVGYHLAIALNKLVAAGLNVSNGLHIIGHSLGAHICGFVGKNTNFTVPRITGLDPAGPGFYERIQRLELTDADFVDIIHTDAGLFGLRREIGHIDFYPNGGVNLQTGCFSGLLGDICGHFRACYYYAESVSNPNAFIGAECASFEDFGNGDCNSNPTEIMGYATPTNARGNFYLKTNGETPYGRGERGARN